MRSVTTPSRPSEDHEPPLAAHASPRASVSKLLARGSASAAIGSSGAAKLVAALAVVAALWWGQVILIPLALSVLISYALDPVIVRLESWHVRRAAAVPLLLTVLLAIAGSGAYALRGEAVAFVDRLPTAAHVIAQAIHGATRGTPGTMAKMQAAARELETAARNATQKTLQDGVTPVRIEEPTFRWSDWLWRSSHGALEFGAQMFAVLCLVYFMLVAGDLYKRKLVGMVPTLTDKKATVELLEEINRQIGRFLIARVVISVVVGLAIWLSFLLMGVEEAALWGVLATVLFTVPLIGPALIVFGAAIAAFLQFGSFGMATAVGGVCLAIGALEGNVLTPWLMGRAGKMSPLAAFVSLLFWGWIWGVWGLLLAVPITAAAKAVCERIPDLHPFADLLAEE